MRKTIGIHERPCAAPGLNSFRYRGPYGWIMIGAKDRDGALHEALRSTSPVSPDRLQSWNGQEYVAAYPNDNLT